MKTWILICISCLVGMTMGIAAGESVDLGPATISLDLGSIGQYAVEKGDSVTMDHKKPRFEYEISSATVSAEGTPDQVLLEVHRMSSSEPLSEQISPGDRLTGLEHCIEQSTMVPRGSEIKTEQFTINGKQGILATVSSDSQDPLYIAAWSPDQSDGSGAIVCLIGSDFSWEITESILNSASASV